MLCRQDGGEQGSQAQTGGGDDMAISIAWPLTSYEKCVNIRYSISSIRSRLQLFAIVYSIVIIEHVERHNTPHVT